MTRYAILALALSLGGCSLPIPVIVAGLGLASGVVKLDTTVAAGWFGDGAAGPVMPATLPVVMVMVPVS